MTTTVTTLMRYYATKNYLIQKIIEKCDFNNCHISNARLSSDKSILQDEDTTIDNIEMQDSTSNEKEFRKDGINSNKTYSTMLKLISGALVGGIN